MSRRDRSTPLEETIRNQLPVPRDGLQLPVMPERTDRLLAESYLSLRTLRKAS